MPLVQQKIRFYVLYAFFSELTVNFRKYYVFYVNLCREITTHFYVTLGRDIATHFNVTITYAPIQEKNNPFLKIMFAQIRDTHFLNRDTFFKRYTLF